MEERAWRMLRAWRNPPYSRAGALVISAVLWVACEEPEDEPLEDGAAPSVPVAAAADDDDAGEEGETGAEGATDDAAEPSANADGSGADAAVEDSATEDAAPAVDGSAMDDRDAPVTPVMDANAPEGDAAVDAAPSTEPDAAQPQANGDAPSCRVGGLGLSNCGRDGNESCCTSLEVAGGSFYRTYIRSSDGGVDVVSDPATVSGFRLDKYKVTVGRFRQFVKAWNDGWRPALEAGKHSHLNAGKGLVASSGGYEEGWRDQFSGPLDPSVYACHPNTTWTSDVGPHENRPMTCVDWSDATKFCIWDGGFLPTETELRYAAAGGAEQRRYPWGSTDYGTGNQYAILSCLYPNGPATPGAAHGACTGAVNFAPVGSALLGAGRWGHMDLNGDQVLEWASDWYGKPVTIYPAYVLYVNPCDDCVTTYADALPSSYVTGGITMPIIHTDGPRYRTTAPILGAGNIAGRTYAFENTRGGNAQSSATGIRCARPTLAPRCVGKRPGDLVCDGQKRRSCGDDLQHYDDHPCPQHTSCRDEGDSASCRCDAPYVDDGAGGCRLNHCLDSPCNNGGVCSETAGGRACDCSATDFEGESCELKIDDCASNPCGHGGICTDGPRSRTCACEGTGFWGPSCNDLTDACHPTPCQHGGRCTVTSAAGAQCDCASTGYSGSLCQVQDTCATTDLCPLALYPCVQSAPQGFTCEGQMADWPMPDTAPGAKLAPSYDTTTPGLVIDNVTGLAWESPPASLHPGCTGPYGPSGEGPDGESCSWFSAPAYCRNLRLGGYSDWRLPTKIELESILDVTRFQPTINETVFPGTRRAAYWTASPVPGASDGTPPAYERAYVVDFEWGMSAEFEKWAPLAIRCVRVHSREPWAETPAQRYQVDVGANTVRDQRTGLVWRRLAEAGTFSWDDAIARCTNGWRLPTYKELLTLIDPATSESSAAFRGESESVGAAGHFWSGTPDIAVYPLPAPESAWVVDQPRGSGFSRDRLESHSVRCVR